MQSLTLNSKPVDLESIVRDVGPLAWVLDELRKSLDGAVKALKRFVRDADLARGSDLAALDSSQLRIARQKLHQSVGALEMVGLPAPAMVLRAMEAAVQKFLQQPENCTAESSSKLERASFALSEYLQGVLSDKPVSAVSLFPQYREIQEIVRADRIHPADLWLREWRWLEPNLSGAMRARNYGPEARTILDQAILRLMKGRSAPSAQELRELCLGCCAGRAAAKNFLEDCSGLLRGACAGLAGARFIRETGDIANFAAVCLPCQGRFFGFAPLGTRPHFFLRAVATFN
jgi:chemosensory pili system protein ChpA (sensor histidine kinase/response regulator)